MEENGLMENTLTRFMIEGRVCIITGGAGLMADSHARAVISGKGSPILLDIDEDKLKEAKDRLESSFPGSVVHTYVTDITDRNKLETVCASVIDQFGHIDVLINNAANNSTKVNPFLFFFIISHFKYI